MTVQGIRETIEAGKMPRASRIEAAGFGRNAAEDARLAFNGSLDAAKRIQDLMLPGWTCALSQSVEHKFWLVQETKHCQSMMGVGFSTDALPSRAWLVAILRALEEEEKAR